jgi:hypothetical protein
VRNSEFRQGKYDTGFVDRLINSGNFELQPTGGRLRE